MRAGRLQTRRIRVRRRFLRVLAILCLLALLTGGGLYLMNKNGWIPLNLSLSPSPTLSPDEVKADTRVMSIPGETWYALQLGVFTSREAADAAAAPFSSRGAAAYLYEDGTSFRVLAAAYKTRAEAQTVMSRLKTDHGIETFIFELSRGEVTLKVHGQAAQLTALESAYACLSGAGGLLADLSAGLDNYTRTEEETRAALTSEEDTVGSLREKLGMLFDDPPVSVKGVLESLTTLSDALTDAQKQTGAALLGAKIKYAQLVALDLLSAYVGALSAGGPDI